MKKTKIDPERDVSIRVQDKTDWSKVYKKSQASVDREAAMDIENPILKNVRFSREPLKNYLRCHRSVKNRLKMLIYYL